MNRSARGGKPAAPGQVRIIGGDLRGSKLPVLDRDGLRPSSDRVRETLFNWLQPVLSGARCLDLFAGSGALGFEAASRGASEVVMIERDRELAGSLAFTAGRLKIDTVRVVETDALRWLQSPPADPAQRFDLVFLDPPFASNLWDGVIERIDCWLAYEAWMSEREAAPDIPHDRYAGARLAFRRGLITNLLNPKAAVFFMTVVPNFVRPDGSVIWQTLLLSAIFVGVATAVHLAIVIMASRLRGLADAPERRRPVRRFLAIVLAGIAIWFGYSTAR